MHFCKIEVSRGERSGAGIRCGRVVACLMGMVLLAGVSRARQQGRQSGTDQAQKAPEANHDAGASGQAGGQQAGKQNAALSREERNRQIVEDSAKLLKLVTDLKIAVDNTTMDTLSILS